MEKVEGEIAQLGLPVLGELTKLSVNIRESMEFKVSYNSSAGAEGAGTTYQAVCKHQRKYGV